jgi:hypothetical protein
VKRKILIDIDVVAVAEHYIKDKDYPMSKSFINRIKSGEFEIYATHSLLELVEKWRREKIKEKVLEIYRTYSYIIPAIEIETRSKQKNVVFEKIVEKLSKIGVKKEDGALAVVSLFGLILITLNRKHLRNKREEINKILKEVNLDGIDILLPNEI